MDLTDIESFERTDPPDYTPAERERFLDQIGRTRMTWRADVLQEDSSGPFGSDVDEWEPRDISEANLISSLTRKGTHLPAIDIDIPMVVVPSSTGGHSHLYFPETELTLEKYLNLLKALRDAKIISAGYYQWAFNNGQSTLRPPWVRKGASNGDA